VGLDSVDLQRTELLSLHAPISDITRIEDIKNRSFAFGSFYSTQGHLIPKIMLEKVGIKIGDLKKYAYLGSHKACAQAVIAGLFDAGGSRTRLL